MRNGFSVLLVLVVGAGKTGQGVQGITGEGHKKGKKDSQRRKHIENVWPKG
jgi:hypothetical protein